MDKKATSGGNEYNNKKIEINLRENIEEVKTRSKSTISGDSYDLSVIDEEIMKLFKHGLFYKREGNLAFRRKNYDKAINNYTKAFEVFNIKFKYSNIENVKIECMTNVAICYYAKNEYFKCLNILNRILESNVNKKCLLLKFKILKLISANDGTDKINFFTQNYKTNKNDNMLNKIFRIYWYWMKNFFKNHKFMITLIFIIIAFYIKNNLHLGNIIDSLSI